MTQESIGRIIDLGCHQPPPNLICRRCIELEREIFTFKAILRMKDAQLKQRDDLILEFLEGYTSRTGSMESALIARFSRLIGYKDITD